LHLRAVRRACQLWRVARGFHLHHLPQKKPIDIATEISLLAHSDIEI